MLQRLLHLFIRPPHIGGRKDPAMPDDPKPSDPAPAPSANAPAPSSSSPAPDVQQQLSALGDAVRLLAESHRTLIDAVTKAPPAPATPASPATSSDVSGDPGAVGVRPGAMVDYSKLTPLQQITVGLRDARPQGARAFARTTVGATTSNDGSVPAGAD